MSNKNINICHKIVCQKTQQSGMLIPLLICSVSFWFTSCKKFVEIDPPRTQLTSSNVFNSDVSAMAAASAIYAQMAYQNAFPNLNLYPALLSDEVVNYSQDPLEIQIGKNDISSDNSKILDLWSAGYNAIYQANAILEGIGNSSGVSEKVKQQVTGEAKFIRAFWHFYLVNLYGDIPLVTSTSYKINGSIKRSEVSAIYAQVIADLKDAETHLSDKYVGIDGISMTNERLRPTKWAAAALLARAYLYSKDWRNAELESSAVIGNTSMFNLLQDLNSVFLRNSQEAIWEIQQTARSFFNTYEGIYFILEVPPATPGYPAITSLSTQLLNAFEPGDARRSSWVNSFDDGVKTYFFPYKYKTFVSSDISEYEMVLRLSEQFLIRAEARAQLDNITGANSAVADLNTIRNRAALDNYAGPIDKSSVLSAILEERRVELFTEWGQRWLDLKRTSTIDAVMSTVTPSKGGGAWNSSKQVYPIPSAEIIANTRLTQNTGY